MEIIKANVKGIQKDYLKQKDDYCLVIDGREGSGKSTLMTHIFLEHEGHILNSPECPKEKLDEAISRITFRGVDFLKALQEAKKGQIIVFDEAEEGMYSKEGMQNLNITIDKALMVSRAKCLFIILVIPSFFMINKYVRLLRIGMLLHCIKPKGTVLGYGHQKKQITKLVMEGQKLFDYDSATPYLEDDFPELKGRFWDAYDKKKMAFVNDFLKTAHKIKKYSLNSASKKLGVSRGYLKKKIEQGKIQADKNKAGHYSITHAELERVKKTKL